MADPAFDVFHGCRLSLDTLWTQAADRASLEK
jgi:hypothetical protein